MRCTYWRGSVQLPEVFIEWDDYLGSNDPIVLTRLDEGAVESHRWGISASKTATFAPRPLLWPGNIIEKFKLARRFVARVVKYDNQTITATWDITGFAAAVQPVEARCA